MQRPAPLAVQMPVSPAGNVSVLEATSEGQAKAAAVGAQAKGKSKEGQKEDDQTGLPTVGREKSGDAEGTAPQELVRLRQEGPVVDPEEEEDRGRGKVIWQDAHDSLPPSAKPEEDVVELPPHATDFARVESQCCGGFGTEDADGIRRQPGQDGGTILDACEQEAQAKDRSAGSSVASSAEAKEMVHEVEEYVQISVSSTAWGGAADPNRSDAAFLCEEERIDREESEPVGSPCMSFTGPNSDMQLVPRSAVPEATPVELGETENADVAQPEDAALLQERMALERMRRFCGTIIKKLAPPLLREVESSSRLRPEAEPFTPRRFTRRATALAGENKKGKKASTAETVLLKALGICPEDLSVDEEHLAHFNELFDSPLGDQHVRVMAAIFGKIVPPRFDGLESCPVLVAAH
jgi:hypothetical protein